MSCYGVDAKQGNAHLAVPAVGTKFLVYLPVAVEQNAATLITLLPTWMILTMMRRMMP